MWLSVGTGLPVSAHATSSSNIIAFHYRIYFRFSYLSTAVSSSSGVWVACCSGNIHKPQYDPQSIEFLFPHIGEPRTSWYKCAWIGTTTAVRTFASCSGWPRPEAAWLVLGHWLLQIACQGSRASLPAPVPDGSTPLFLREGQIIRECRRCCRCRRVPSPATGHLVLR